MQRSEAGRDGRPGLQAGQYSATNNGASSTLVVSTSTTAVHDTTSVAMIKFPFSGSIAGQSSASPATSADVLTAVLELTVAVPPAADMLMTVCAPHSERPARLTPTAAPASAACVCSVDAPLADAYTTHVWACPLRSAQLDKALIAGVAPPQIVGLSGTANAYAGTWSDCARLAAAILCSGVGLLAPALQRQYSPTRLPQNPAALLADAPAPALHALVPTGGSLPGSRGA